MRVGHRFRPRVTRAVLLSGFALFGVSVGTQAVVWADLVGALRLGEGIFGTVQLVPPVVSVALMLYGGALCARAGKRRLAAWSYAFLAGSAAGLAGAEGLAGLLVALVLGGVAAGLLEIALNGATLDWEQATGRPAMNVMHAGWSGGAVVGALGAGALLELGVGYGWVLALLAVLCLLTGGATLLVGYPPADGGGVAVGGLGATLRLLRSRRALGVLAICGALSVVNESVALTWSVIHLTRLGATALVGGSAFALFGGAMFLGRLANARLVARVGPRTSLVVSGAGLVLAALLLVASGSVVPATVAFAVSGLAGAGVVPTVLSAAAHVVPGASGAVASALMAAAYVGFVLCPPLVGWVAELASLRVALLSIGLAGAGILWLARGVRPSPEVEQQDLRRRPAGDGH